MKPITCVPICCGFLSLLLSFFAPEFYLHKTAINSVVPLSDREIGNLMLLLALGFALIGIVVGFVLRKKCYKNFIIGVGVVLSLIALLYNLLGIPI